MERARLVYFLSTRPALSSSASALTTLFLLTFNRAASAVLLACAVSAWCSSLRSAAPSADTTTPPPETCTTVRGRPRCPLRSITCSIFSLFLPLIEKPLHTSGPHLYKCPISRVSRTLNYQQSASTI